MNGLNTPIKSQRLLDWILKSKIQHVALTGAAQLVGCHPAEQKVAGSIPSQGTSLGYWSGPGQEHV